MKNKGLLPPYCRQVADCIYDLTPEFRAGMQVPVRLIADEELLERWMVSKQLDQLIELASLRGSTEHVVGLPNLNEGDDTPSGVVAAMSYPEGFVVPWAVGSDINCGLRLLTSAVPGRELTPRLPAILEELERATPVGSDRGKRLALSPREMDELLKEGCRFLVREKGIGTDADLDAIPSAGHFHDAHGEHLSATAKALGLSQLGTLGRGRSHFVEVGVIEEVNDRAAADQLTLTEGSVAVLIHSGARALGERTYVEAVGLATAAMKRLRLAPSPRGLAYAPLDSEEGLWCYHALRAAANYGWANRHVLTHQARLAFQRVFSDGSAQLRVACDSPSNTVDLQRIDGRLLCLHRHAATSAHGPGISDQVPPAYRTLGTPMVLPGSMGSSSYVLIATEAAEALSLASACHGAGRVMSRKEARKALTPHELKEELAQRDVLARSPEPADLRHQIPEAYRDVETVLAILERAGVARRVARIRPRGVLKS